MSLVTRMDPVGKVRRLEEPAASHEREPVVARRDAFERYILHHRA